ncbi:MAG TPA: orotidine-5'-phosphate decarboxylase [Gemmataceae bacterium]|nr:orotidine-5'-phosphate decarboxylase [Gemmataceae bacterium]
MTHFADRLADAIRAKGNAVCVGLDPRWDSLPIELRQRHGSETLASVAAAYEGFCSRVIDIVAPLAPVVKPQSAFFEACGPEGMAALQRLLRKARERNLITILDGKRNDIASTASAYADAAFGGTRLAGRTYPVWEADALTINPYLGRDAVEPFVESARRVGAGLFVLVRTSNAGAGQFQDLLVTSEATPPRPLYQHVGEAVAAWARENLGICGLGDVGAVVGATYPDELATLRKLLPEVTFLVPGFGTQGGTAADVAPAFRPDGLGAVVNSSRGILFPFQPDEPRWEVRIEEATRAAIAALQTRRAGSVSDG